MFAGGGSQTKGNTKMGSNWAPREYMEGKHFCGWKHVSFLHSEQWDEILRARTRAHTVGPEPAAPLGPNFKLNNNKQTRRGSKR